MSKREKVEASAGLINLKAKDGALYKKALLCRTGKFDGMFGPITVTVELLKGLCEKYNRDHEKPQNENDYAPILKDHMRSVDLFCGRIMADLSVEPWTDPETEIVEEGLFGTLRVDVKDAQEKVDSGQYAQLSISFDEETLELFEVSFVAVEAARRSIVLAQKTGGRMELAKRLSSLAQKHQALAAMVQKGHEKRKVSLAKIAKDSKESSETLKSLSEGLKSTSLKLKQAQTKAAMLGFVKQGKMSPIEFKKLDFKALAALDGSALKFLTDSYESREVSPDLIQFGQGGDVDYTEMDASLTPAKMRAAIELQRAGKGSAPVVLSEEEKEEQKKKLAEKDPKEGGGSMDHEEFKKCLDEMDAHHKSLMEIHTKLCDMHKESEDMAEGDEKEKEEEKKQMSNEDGKEGE